MTAHEIVALKCPSCGSGANQPSREMSFGAEFRCGHCGATSVLIVDGALIALGTLQALGETVCTSCGRTSAHSLPSSATSNLHTACDSEGDRCGSSAVDKDSRG